MYYFQTDKEYYNKYDFLVVVSKIYVEKETNTISFSVYNNGEEIEIEEVNFFKLADKKTIVSDDLIEEEINFNPKSFLEELKEYINEKFCLIIYLKDDKNINYFLNNNFKIIANNNDYKVLEGNL